MAEIELRKVEKVDEELIREIVDRILKVVSPEKIILFGSQEYSKPKKGSDIDILVVMKSDKPGYERSVPIYEALAGLLIPKDVVVYTPEEIEEWSEVPQAFITTIVKKGEVIYEKQN